MLEDRLEDYLRARLFLFQSVQPQDDRARAVLFARDNELRQLIFEFRMDRTMSLPPPIPEPPGLLR